VAGLSDLLMNPGTMPVQRSNQFDQLFGVDGWVNQSTPNASPMEMLYTTQDAAEAAARRQRNAVIPHYGRQEGAATKFVEDTFGIPKTPLDAAALALGGPFGRAAKTGMLAAGAALTSEDADAGPLSKLVRSVLPMDEASRMARAVQQNYKIDAYHGTRSPQEITEFQTGAIYSDAGELLHPYSQHPNSLIGPHFAAEPETANKFAMGTGADWLKSRFTEGNPAVYPVKLDATKVQRFKSEDDLDTLLFRQKANAQEVEAVIESRFPDDIEAGFLKYDRDKAFREQVNREAVMNENNYDEPASEVGQELADAVRRAYEKAGVTTIQYPNAVEGGTSYISIAHPRSRWAAFDPDKKDSRNILSSILAAGGTPLAALMMGEDAPVR
jgi:hypothetical protein